MCRDVEALSLGGQIALGHLMMTVGGGRGGLEALKGLVINYGEGDYKTRKSRVGNLLRPPSRQGKTFRAPPFKEWKLVAPFLSIWLKLQAPV